MGNVNQEQAKNGLIGVHGKRKIRLIGPTDHDDIHRFGWKEPANKAMGEPECLCVRLEKGEPTCDRVNFPIFLLFFAYKYLHIAQSLADQKGLLNPYINVVQRFAPQFVVPKKCLKEEYIVTTMSGLFCLLF